jgi:hypothetical protein
LQTLIEGKGDKSIVFEFPVEWETLKYDAPEGFYKNSVAKCQNTKAIDFLIIENQRQLWIEVKNFRGNNEGNRIRLDPNENNVPGLFTTREFVETNFSKEQILVSRKKTYLADEITQKVRDTCAGLIGAFLQDIPEFLPFSIALNSKLPIHIILFLQQDEKIDNANDFKRMAQRLADKIKQQLVFLNVSVEVVNQFTLSPNVQWRISGNNP